MSKMQFNSEWDFSQFKSIRIYIFFISFKGRLGHRKAIFLLENVQGTTFWQL